MGAYGVQGAEAEQVEVAEVNAQQAAAWDGHEGDVWTEHADRYDRASERILKLFFEKVPVGVADRVLDVGCGTGSPTRAAARRAPGGAVTGVDLSTRMLEMARRRSLEEGLANATFVHADAQVFPFEPASVDLAMSSFGAMFFGDPVAAFTNITRAVRPGGRLALLAWRSFAENEWLTALFAALAAGRDLPVPPPDAPTPFALADPDRVRTILGRARLVDVELEPIDEMVDLGRDAADAGVFARDMGLVGMLVGELDAGARATAWANLASLFEAHETPDGVLFDSAAWLVTASKPPAGGPGPG